MKVATYVEKCFKKPLQYAAVPVPVAADFLQVSREAVSERVRSGKLQGVTVKGRERNWKLILVSSLVSTTQEMEEMEGNMVEQATELLMNAARVQKKINYGTLMEQLGLSYRNPQHRKEIGSILGIISKKSYEDEDQGFMLSALAVRKGSGLPNEAFFELADSIEAMEEGDDPKDFWEDQLEEIFSYFDEDEE